MKSADLPTNERERLAELRATGLLDSLPESSFDDLTKIASIICGTPIALISLVDERRQWFKSRVGLDATETSREIAFCAHAILSDELFVVSDAHQDPRFADNPLVLGSPNVRFYAGAPLTTESGASLGTLCVIDDVPRELTAGQRFALEALGRQVVSLLELRTSSARLEAEVAARRAAEENTRRFFSLSIDPLCVAGHDGFFRDLNPAWERLLGFSTEELAKTPFFELIHPDDRGKTQEIMAGLAAGRAVGAFENRFRCRDGSYRIFQWSVVPDPTSGLIYAAGRDLTEARKTSAERDRLAEIIDQTPDFVGTSDMDGKVTYLNRAARRLLGVPLDADLAGLTDVRYHPEWATRRIWEEAVPAAIRDGSWLGESAMLDHAGREVPITETVIAHAGPEGKAAFLSGLGRDISAFKEVDRLKSEFVSTVSHELRTPLTSIHGSLRLLASEIKGELPPDVMKLVRIAETNTERLIRLVNDILDIEKIEAGKLEIRPARLDPQACIDAAFDAVRGMADQSGVRLASTSATRTAFRGDFDRITQVVVNLLSNAIKYSSSGQEVGITIMQAENRIRFEVTDHGPGIPATDLPRLFGKFQQLDSSDSRARGGSGLGLAICKAIVESHGGRMGVESTVGAGSTFWFEIPDVVPSA